MRDLSAPQYRRQHLYAFGCKHSQRAVGRLACPAQMAMSRASFLGDARLAIPLDLSNTCRMHLNHSPKPYPSASHANIDASGHQRQRGYRMLREGTNVSTG